MMFLLFCPPPVGYAVGYEHIFGVYTHLVKILAHVVYFDVDRLNFRGGTVIGRAI